VEKLANIESKIEEYNSVQETLKTYASKGFNVEASLKDLELQKQNVNLLEEKTNEKLAEILKMLD
jgi:fructose-1-phosphate kinase PfkB-like protein